jgi:hypothetical protein
MDAPNLDIAREQRGLHRPKLERLDRLFPEDAASTSLEDDASMNVEEAASTSLQPSISRRIFRASAVFSFVVLTGVGGALAWRSYGDYATEMIRAWALPTPPSKPAAPPAGAAEIQQQLKSIVIDLAAVKHTLEQLGANQDPDARRFCSPRPLSAASFATPKELTKGDSQQAVGAAIAASFAFIPRLIVAFRQVEKLQQRFNRRSFCGGPPIRVQPCRPDVSAVFLADYVGLEMSLSTAARCTERACG